MRAYTEKNSGKKCYIEYNSNEGNHFVMDENYERMNVNFYCCAFTDLDLKMKDKSIVNLSMGEVLFFDSDNPPVAKKFFMQKRFRKL